MERRGEAIARGSEEELDRLTTEFRKSKAKDRREGLLNAVKNELDIRDRWAGIRRVRSTFPPHPYSRKEGHTGKHIHMKKRAEKSSGVPKLGTMGEERIGAGRERKKRKMEERDHNRKG